jgi:pimeloyl-ACP methyl ester carboxylesterase
LSSAVPVCRPFEDSSLVLLLRVMFMPGVGHFLMMEDPKRFNDLLRVAIAKLVQ